MPLLYELYGNTVKGTLLTNAKDFQIMVPILRSPSPFRFLFSFLIHATMSGMDVFSATISDPANPA
jgi:hypothetical protein